MTTMDEALTIVQSVRNENRLNLLAQNAYRLQAVCVNSQWVEVAEAQGPSGGHAKSMAQLNSETGQLDFLALNEPHWYYVPVESVQAWRVDIDR